MELSVVIPTYRKPRMLDRTLSALERELSSLGGGIEVVVVDDGSADDETPVVIARHATTLPLVEAGGGRNEGRARARNRGWRAARGESVLFLDDDIVLRDGALRAHLLAQKERPAVWLGDVVSAREIVDSPLFDYLDSRGIAKCAPGQRVPSRYLLTQNVSIPRAALESVGGFDEHFGAYGFEDMEIAFRLEDEVGLEFYRLPDAVGDHVHHHTLHEYLDKKRVCGRETLPQLAALHPDRMSEMGLGVLFDRGDRPALRRALRFSWSLGLPRLVGAWFRATGSVWPRPLRHRALDYLVVSAYASGMGRRNLPARQ